MSATGITNEMRLQAQRAISQLGLVRIGIVTSYDPDHYAARVEIQPEGVETGWLPVSSSWVGDEWGDYSPPSIGSVVEVQFQEGGREAGFVGKRFYSNVTRPLPVPSGEWWRVHKSGSLIKFKNDGTVELSAHETLRLTGKNIQIHATEKYRFDVNGHGQSWLPDRVNTYQGGEVAGTAHDISPPEIGD